MIKFNPEMKVRKFEIEIEGVKNVPLVMDKYDTSVKINLNPTEEQIIKYVEQKVYRNEDGEIALPTNALKGILKQMCPYIGGKMESKRNTVAIKAGVFFDSIFWVLKKQNNNSVFKTYDEYGTWVVTSTTGKTQTRQPTWRPVFKDWKANGIVTILGIDPLTVKDMLTQGGLMFALLSMRPDYGRFILTKFEEKK